MTVPELENPGLVRDLVSWVAAGPRPYDEVMDAWRTSCPRLTVWEDALDAGFVAVGYAPSGHGRLVSVTEAGRRFLDLSGMSG